MAGDRYPILQRREDPGINFLDDHRKLEQIDLTTDFLSLWYAALNLKKNGTLCGQDIDLDERNLSQYC